jgi:ABC-type molybdate transport system ATPase subunit
MHIVLPHDGDPAQRIALFPRDIYVSDTLPPGPQVNRFKGTITDITPYGATVKLEVKVKEHTLLAEMPHDIFEDMDLTAGKEVFLILKLRRIKVFEGKDSR